MASEEVVNQTVVEEQHQEEVDEAPSSITGSSGQTVTPFDVQAGEKGVDYNRLIDEFGCQLISDELLARFERLTGRRPHRWLRRGYFFSHR
jgi:tryptophanyl-tRNA synthetase